MAQDIPRSYYQLGRAYLASGDNAEGTNYYRQAAELGHLYAAFWIAEYTRLGEYGVEKTHNARSNSMPRIRKPAVNFQNSASHACTFMEKMEFRGMTLKRCDYFGSWNLMVLHPLTTFLAKSINLATEVNFKHYQNETTSVEEVTNTLTGLLKTILLGSAE